MSRLGRGRSRAGKILDMTDIRTTLESERTLGGRGIVAPTNEEFEPHMMMFGRGSTLRQTETATNAISTGRGISTLLPNDTRPTKSNVTYEGPKKKLERELTALEKTGTGSLILITLNYFSQDNDTEFYVNKLMDSILKSSVGVEKYTMCWKLLTLLEDHGENTKVKMFSKLQSTFQEMVKLMEGGIINLNEGDTMKITNFCDLMGELYFRFRPRLGDPERYHVLASPAAQCMIFLATVSGTHQLRILSKLILFNYKALHQGFKSKIEQLNEAAHMALLDREGNKEDKALLMFVIDYTSLGDKNLPSYLVQFYSEHLGNELVELTTKSTVQILEDLPPSLTESQMEKFTVSSAEYNQHKFVDL